MSVTQATEELINLGTALFPPEQEEMPSAEENSKRLKEAVEEMVERQQLPIDIKLKDARLPGSHCKVYVPFFIMDLCLLATSGLYSRVHAIMPPIAYHFERILLESEASTAL